MKITITIDDATPETLAALTAVTSGASTTAAEASARPADHTPAPTTAPAADRTPATPVPDDLDTLITTVRTRVGELVAVGSQGKSRVRAALAAQGVKKVTELPETREAYAALLEALS